MAGRVGLEVPCCLPEVLLGVGPRRHASGLVMSWVLGCFVRVAVRDDGAECGLRSWEIGAPVEEPGLEPNPELEYSRVAR